MRKLQQTVVTAEQALRASPSNLNAAKLLRAVMQAESEDQINDDDVANKLIEVIEYLENN
jgi:hypothetical protein